MSTMVREKVLWHSIHINLTWRLLLSFSCHQVPLEFAKTLIVNQTLKTIMSAPSDSKYPQSRAWGRSPILFENLMDGNVCTISSYHLS
jgi:hypothetical protein